MELILEKSLPHQEKAINAINKVFEGVKFINPQITEANPTFNINDPIIKQNIAELQKSIKPSQKGCASNLPYLPIDIKMETGTGKTYVYTQTIFELHKNCGFNKFIIVVPSLPIKSGTKNFMADSTVSHHFSDSCGYNAQIHLDVLESQKTTSKGFRNFPPAITDFIHGSSQNSKAIYVLLVNMSLLTNGKMLSRDDYDSNLLSNINRPFDALRQTKPIVLIDEPHRFSQDNKAMNVIVEELKPQSIIRFGATFPELKKDKKSTDLIPLGKTKDYNNLVYELNACDSFMQNLIKGIKKEHPDSPSKKEEKIKLVSVESKKTANFQFITGDKKKTFTLSQNDSLSVISNDLNGVVINNIGKNFIELSNGLTKYTGEEFDTLSYSASYQEIMLGLALDRHFETERVNFARSSNKIKTLALFFIDDIYSYRETEEKTPYLKIAFEKLLKEKITNLIAKLEDWETEYKEFLQASLNDIACCHAGYFSQDNSDSDEDIALEVDDILNNKKKLLSIRDENGNFNTRRFLFSKWTLKEGWDNPNIFTIAKLRSSGSDNSKLQEVGRGLRLPVDEYGNRISNAQFELNYIVDFTEKDFANRLIQEVNGELENITQITDELLEKVAKARNIDAEELFDNLHSQKFIDRKCNLIQENIERFYAEYPEFMSETQANTRSKIKDANQTKTSDVKIRKENFDKLKELWNTINQKYYLLLEDELNKNIETELNNIFTEDDIFSEVAIITKAESVKATTQGLTLAEESGKSYLIQRPISYSEFLKRINVATNIPINVIHKALVEYNKTNKIEDSYINEASCARIIKRVQDWKVAALLEKFTYSKSNIQKKETALTNSSGTVKSSIPASSVGTFMTPTTSVDKYLYDKIAYDSPIEKENIASEIEKVTVYAKIPRRSISIPTITGENYSPDFMYVVKHKDGSKKLNLIIESKDVKQESDLRNVESTKIKCAEKFFEQISKENNLNIDFRKQITGQKIIQLIEEIGK